MITTTGNEVNGLAISEYLGIVRGIVVRSPTISQGLLGGLKQVPMQLSACGTTRPSSPKVAPRCWPTAPP
jgi:uncharacterized protein YbjQ (UPF0145 family)